MRKYNNETLLSLAGNAFNGFACGAVLMAAFPFINLAPPSVPLPLQSGTYEPPTWAF